MTEYVPASEVRRIAIRAESDGELFEEDSQPRRVAEKIASDIRECADTHAVEEREICNE